MLTEAATGTLIGNNRILTFLQAHGPPLNGTTFIATPAEQKFGPCITLLSIQLSKAHSYFFNGDIVQCIRGTDGGTTHAKMAGSFLGIDLRSTCHKKVKSPSHLDTVENANLSALAAL